MIINKWTKHCPKCNIKQTYTTKASLETAIIQNTHCYKCFKPPARTNFKRICSYCSKEIIYSSIQNYCRAIRINGRCKYCKIHTAVCTAEHRRKISESRKGKCIGNDHPAFNKCKPSYIREKISKTLRGNIRCLHTEETKKKMRIASLKRIELLGIGTSTDAGSKEWFNKYNKETNSNFKPKRFLNIGYDADGYDIKKHIWIEYDTYYHIPPQRKEKDLLREQRIIQHFIDIGEPLVSFIRVLAYKNEEIITKYRGYGY